MFKQSQEGNGPIIQNLLKTIASKMLPKCAQNRFIFQETSWSRKWRELCHKEDNFDEKEAAAKNSQEQQPAKSLI